MQTLTQNQHQEIQEKILKTYQQALPDLIFQAQQVHRQYHDPKQIQFCTLSSIKTGACPEDCKYCAQSASYDTDLKYEALISKDQVMKQAQQAKEEGSTRFCMGAAWREIPRNEQFEQVLDMVKSVRELGLEPCVTLGMLNQEQAIKLKEAGLHSYNHNLDCSETFYSQVISTRTFQDRIQTINYVQQAGINVCSGGILGLGESQEDRVSMLASLALLDPQPSSVPINVLVPIPGTPFEANETLDNFELVRSVASSRIFIPRARIRLSAGRLTMSDELQALCFLAGANSIHTGSKLLTAELKGQEADHKLIVRLGMQVLQ